MAYGLKIYNSSGQIRLDTGDNLARLVYSTTVSANVSGSITLSELNGLSSKQFSILAEASCTKGAHTVTRSGNTFYWAYNRRTTFPAYSSGNSIIYVYLTS